MHRTNFTDYDIKPEGMVNYLRYNGPHFSNRLCKFAVSLMEIKKDGKEIKFDPYTKEYVDGLLRKYNVALNNNQLYDYVYVANMCKADFLGSSIKDEQHLALYVKDVIDDVDGYDGIVFNRWYADMCNIGMAIDWDYML